MDMKEKFIS